MPILTPPLTKKLHIAAAYAASGNQVIIPAPSKDLEIVITSFYLQNASAIATTAKLITNSFTFFQRLFQTQGSDILIVNNPGMEDRLGAGQSLTLNLSGANSFNVDICYWLDTAI